MVSELISVLSTLAPILGHNVGTFMEMAKGIYCISSGGVTQENISRWTGRLGSYRSLQRLMHSNIDWLKLNLLLLQSYWLEAGSDSFRYILAVDEVVEDKAGKQTHGVSWFYSSIAGQVIRAVSFHAISLVDTQKERSFALHQIQNIRDKQESGPKRKPAGKGKQGAKSSSQQSCGADKGMTGKQANSQAEASVNTKKKRAGRPKGSRNKQKKAVNSEKKRAGRPKGSKNKQHELEHTPLSIGFMTLLNAVHVVLRTLGVAIKYVAADGAYGNKTCLLLAKACGLHLVSKLNRNTSLFLPFSGVYRGGGAPQKYGEQIKYGALPEGNLRSTKTEDGVKTQIYQFKKVWTRQIPDLINVVIIVKTKIAENTTAHAVLCSSDTDLDWERLMQFYCLRFQIEFNFRDAKQYFGLADFKNIKPQSVINAVGMAFFMGNLSLILLEQAKVKYQTEVCSIQDLKAIFRADFYLQSILNTLHLTDQPILNDSKFHHIFTIGAVNLKKRAA